MAMMRTKLRLSEKEFLDRSWILSVVESKDFPYYDYKKEKGIKVKNKNQANDILKKYM